VCSSDLFDKLLLHFTDTLFDKSAQIVRSSGFGLCPMPEVNRAVNPKWQSCFRHRATAFNANFSASAVVFQADTANLHVDEYHLPMAMTMFKQYCEAANEEYAKQATEEHHQNQLQICAQLQLRVAQQEQKARVLAKVQL
jgi:hypothetical protein